MHVTGVLKRTEKGGVLRDPARSFKHGPRDATVPFALMKQYNLHEGVKIEGIGREQKRAPEVVEITSLCGLPPEEFMARKPFNQLTAIDPLERFHLGITGDPCMRIMDLISPIGKGTRGLIVSPPKAGKTMMLEAIARSIRREYPDARIIALLIDERPEEVTHFRRAVDVEVLASSNDQTNEEHVELSELTLAHVRTELECGRNVVVLIDSITRMGRAFNIMGSGSGRTMSGGLEAGALELPRRFFGLARNVEHGGSVTIIATALVQTGSRMDDFIFQEFKGTGNCEIVLDRGLSEQRIFPAVNVNESGTRKEANLYSPEEYKGMTALRRVLASYSTEDALKFLLMLIDKYADNTALLKYLAKSG